MERVSIVDFQAGEEVGTLHADGTLVTDDDSLRELYEELRADGGPRVMDGYIDEDGNISEGFVPIEPDEQGFLRAVIDSLSSPYDAPPETLRELPNSDISDEQRIGPPDDS